MSTISSTSPFADLAARAAAAGGKPLFSAEAAPTDAADRVEPGAEQKKKEARLQDKAVDVADSLKLKLEELEKQKQQVVDRADAKVGKEERAKADKLGSLKDGLGAREEDVKARAGDRLTNAEERAKGNGRELNPELADALKTRVADEQTQKGARLDGTADRFQAQEEAIKARMKERVDDRVGKVDERTVKTADRGAMRLEGLEDRMKAEEKLKQRGRDVDQVGGGKDEQFTKEKAAKAAATDGAAVIDATRVI